MSTVQADLLPNVTRRLHKSPGAAVFAERSQSARPLGQGVLDLRLHTTAMPKMHANKALKRPLVGNASPAEVRQEISEVGKTRFGRLPARLQNRPRGPKIHFWGSNPHFFDVFFGASFSDRLRDRFWVDFGRPEP